MKEARVHLAPQGNTRVIVPALNSVWKGRKAIRVTDEEVYARGIGDGLDPAVVSNEITSRDARKQAELANLRSCVRPVLKALAVEQSQVHRDLEAARNRPPHLAVSPLLKSLVYGASFVGTAVIDVSLLMPSMGSYGPGEATRLKASMAAVVLPALALEFAIHRRPRPESILHLPITRWIVGGMALAVPVAITAYRNTLWPVEATQHGGILELAMEATRAPATIVLLLLSTTLTVCGALLLERCKHSYERHRAESEVDRLQRLADGIEKDIAVLSEEEGGFKERIEADSEVDHYDYLRGVFKAHTEEPAKSWLPSFLRRISLPSVAGIIALALALFFLTGCGLVPGKPSEGIAILDDESLSLVTLTPEQRLGAVMTALSRVSCSTVTVIPVNATVRDPYEVTLPCEDRDGYGDEYRQAYKRTEEELRSRFLLWAKDSNASDYGGALHLASRFLAHFETKRLIIIGDLKQSGGNGEFRVVKGVPSLGDAKFPGAKVYLGFIESRGTGRASSSFRAAWTKAFQSAGVLDGDITSTPFGLEELRLWCETNIGPVNPAYERFEAARR